MFDLSGKIGVITGASSGIGLATANVLAEAGAKVYSISRSGHPKDPEEYCHSNIIHKQGDINNHEQMKELIKEIGDAQGIDFLVNNAVISVKKRAEEITDEEFASVMSTNVNSIFRVSNLCYPYLKKSKNRGRIINISSMAAHLGFSLVVPYCASKSAVLGLTRGLAVEWAQDNINVNSVAPGWFPSELLKEVMDDKRKAQILNRMPVHKFGDPREIGATILYLTANESEYVTGQDFAVDGGALAYGF